MGAVTLSTMFTYLLSVQCQSSGVVRKSRWQSLIVFMFSVDVKQHYKKKKGSEF